MSSIIFFAEQELHHEEADTASIKNFESLFKCYKQVCLYYRRREYDS
jgi:hypothetical protein